MKALFIFIFILAALPLMAHADPRVHLDTQACHIPWNVNTDNEAKLSCDAALNERDGVVSAWANEHRDGVPKSALPVLPPRIHEGNNVDPSSTSRPQVVRCSQTTVSNIGTCSITDDDGNAYSTGDWTATTRVCPQKKKDGLGYSVDYSVECPNAARN